jgi:hypothetical protein
MRRLIAFVLMVAFCVAFLSPAASATQWDPRYGPWVHLDNHENTPSGDDGAWNDEYSSPFWQGGSLLGCCDIRITAPTLFLWFFDLMDVPNSPDQGNGNDRQSLDHDRRSSTQ